MTIQDGVPLGGMADNWEVFQGLKQQQRARQAAKETSHARHKAAADAMTGRLDWPQLSRLQTGRPAVCTVAPPRAIHRLYGRAAWLDRMDARPWADASPHAAPSRPE